jgi:hypothetical protein
MRRAVRYYHDTLFFFSILGLPHSAHQAVVIHIHHLIQLGIRMNFSMESSTFAAINIRVRSFSRRCPLAQNKEWRTACGRIHEGSTVTVGGLQPRSRRTADYRLSCRGFSLA